MRLVPLISVWTILHNDLQDPMGISPCFNWVLPVSVPKFCEIVLNIRDLILCSYKAEHCWVSPSHWLQKLCFVVFEKGPCLQLVHDFSNNFFLTLHSSPGIYQLWVNISYLHEWLNASIFWIFSNICPEFTKTYYLTKGVHS